MRLLILLVACAHLSGCWYTQVTNGMVSTRNIEFGDSCKTYYIDRSHKVCAYDRTHIILVHPFGGPNADDAINKALDDVQGDRPVIGLSDAHVKWRWFFIPILAWIVGYGQTWYSVEGYPIYELAEKPKAKASAAIERPITTNIKDVKEPKPLQEEQADDFRDLPF